MEKKSGFGRNLAVAAITLVFGIFSVGLVGVAIGADAPKDKPADVKATLSDQKAKAPEPNDEKNAEKAVTQTDPVQLLIKGSKTFMEGADMIKDKKDKPTAQKMMLEGHKMMADTETAWAKTKKELTSGQKAVSEGHAMMMKGYTLLKGDKETEQGSQMVSDGFKKLNEGLKSLQSSTNGKDKK